MTADHEPRNPSDATARETVLADRLAAIADRHVPAPDWDDVTQRAGDPQMIPLRPLAAAGKRAEARTPFGRNVLAVAAAVTVLVGGIGAYLAGRDGGDERDQTHAGPPAPGDELTDTGWYVPTALPDGWEVTSIESSELSLVGPAALTAWAAPDGSASLSHAFEPLDDNLQMGDAPRIQLTGEISGRVLTEYSGYPGSVAWEHGDRFHLVTGNGLEVEEVKDAARQIAADPERTSSPLDGLDLISHTDRADQERPITDVTIGVMTADRRQMFYSLTPTGTVSRSALIRTIPLRRTIEGQPLEVLELKAAPGVERLAASHLGLWPGADITLPLLVPPEADDRDAPTEKEVLTLIAALRPATAEEWRDFVDRSGVDVEPELRTAARLDGLGGEGDVASTTDDHQEIGGAPLQYLSGDAIGGADLSSVESGGVLMWSISAHNSTGRPMDFPQCLLDRSWARFVPASTPDTTTPQPRDVDCDDDAIARTLAPGEQIELPMSRFSEVGLPAREVVGGEGKDAYLGGTLPPGQYRAVWATTSSGASVDVEVTEHPCGGFTTEFVDRYMFLSLAGAEARAQGDGMTLRPVRTDGVEQEVTGDHRCDRVDVAVEDDRVVAVVDVG